MSGFILPHLAHVVAEAQRQQNGVAVLFNEALAAGLRRTWWKALTRQGNALQRLAAARPAVPGGRYAGLQEVALADIRGSEGRSREFDDEFYPRTTAARERWQRVASAWEAGVRLPPVLLIKLGDAYYVRDGHHRISVARALGQASIEAEVIEWDL
jgi:hypothetical protein